MITWKLWAALQHPPAAHPVFRHIQASRRAVGVWPAVVITVFCALIGYGCYEWSFTSIPAPVRLILFSFTLQDVLVIFISFNLVYGCILAAGISQTLARTRAQGIYEMLCLTPSGAAGVNWAMSTAVLYRRPGFRWFRLGTLLLTAIPAISICIHLTLTLLALSGMIFGFSAMPDAVIQSYSRMLLDLIYALTLVTAFYTSTIQSVVMAVLSGMLTAATTSDGSARFISIGIFLMAQVLTFVLALVIGFVILPGIYQTLQLENGIAGLLLPVARLAFFFALRELVILFLWRSLARQLTGQSDIHAALIGNTL